MIAKPRRRLSAAVGAATVSVSLLATCPGRTSELDADPVAHVTVYLDEPIVVEGGALIVVGRPLPEAEWHRLKHAANPTRDDPDNPKRAELRPTDRHFGAVASSPVTYVEFRYPEGGSYTFNILPAPAVSRPGANDLETERVLIGSADMVPDPEGGYIYWPSLSVIAVIGSERGRDFAYLANATGMDALADGAEVEHFEGVRTISLTPGQIARYVWE